MIRCSEFDSQPRIILFRRYILTAETTTLASLLSNLSTIATSVFGWAGDAANTIVGNPFLLLTTGFLVVGGAVGILGRLLSKN